MRKKGSRGKSGYAKAVQYFESLLTIDHHCFESNHKSLHSASSKRVLILGGWRRTRLLTRIPVHRG